jgi:ribosome maturation factor RimP
MGVMPIFLWLKSAMLTIPELEQLIAPVLNVLGFELVGCRFVSEFGRQTLRIFIDGPEGVTVDDCTQVGRQINAVLAVNSSVGQSYDVEVSSPGLDRPLFTLAHFQRFIGQQVKLSLREPLSGRRNFTGKLVSADASGNVVIHMDEQDVTLAFDNIEKANLVPDLRF